MLAPLTAGPRSSALFVRTQRDGHAAPPIGRCP